MKAVESRGKYVRSNKSHRFLHKKTSILSNKA